LESLKISKIDLESKAFFTPLKPPEELLGAKQDKL
jgi:hypothetical protein